MSFIEDRIAERLGGRQFGKKTELYKFEKIKQAKREALAKNPTRKIIDMGVGEPDRPAHNSIVDVLCREAGRPENRFYSDNGIPAFQHAAAGFLKDVYGVKVEDPEAQIIHGVGSKPVLAMLPICFINPGDYILTTSPGYPVSGTYTSYLGGAVHSLPLQEQNDYYPDFDSIPRSVLEKAKLLYLNYPNNPTGQVASEEFFKEVVSFASKNNIFVIHDASYSALTFEDCRPLSFLSVEGAFEVGIEVHSLSKSYNMTGWRLGFAVGSPQAIKAYGTVKDNTDSGQFRAIQKAGIYALEHPELIEENKNRYSQRFDQLIPLLQELGFAAEKPKATFYCYVRAPRGSRGGYSFNSAEECATFLIREASISTVPWDEAGPYLRFSVTFEARNRQEEQGVVEELRSRLEKLGLVF